MDMLRQARADLRVRRHWRKATRRASGEPVIITLNGQPRHVLMSLDQYNWLRSLDPEAHREAAPSPAVTGTPDLPRFPVLCRIDAYADYVAEVEADDAEEAAQLARDNHGDYKWEHSFTQEFDARLYVTLDGNGNEIEDTQVGDF
jgi:PHD/YefM family antitoxin component YafN of YafNO toxin-antitoxin module